MAGSDDYESSVTHAYFFLLFFVDASLVSLVSRKILFQQPFLVKSFRVIATRGRM